MKRLPAILLLSSAVLCAGPEDSFLIRGATIHTAAGPSLPNAALLVIDGRIAAIGPTVAAPKGIRIVDGKGLQVYPGMIDSATAAGLSEIGSVRETNDVRELGDFNPQLRAHVAVNPSSEHIPVIRANGITATVVVPDGRLIGGRAAMMHLDGWTWEEMLLAPDVALQLAFPTLAVAPRSSFDEAKTQYRRRLQELSNYVETARRYQRAKANPAPDFRIDLALEAMLPVLERKLPLLVTAVRERAIRDAVAWADSENVRIILAEVREPGSMLSELQRRSIPVILGPTQALPLQEDDPYDAAFTLPAALFRAGVKFAFGSFGNMNARNLPYQAATAVAFGLPADEALKSVTRYPAEIWGVADRVGTIETGKLADLMVTDGDPLEVRTQVKQVFIAGRAVDLESRHTRLYKRYLARP